METLILVPIGAAFWQVCQKVSTLRQEVADRDVQIEQLQATVTQRGGSDGGAGIATSAGAGGARAALVAGMALSGAAALYQGGRFMYRVRQQNGGGSNTPSPQPGDVVVLSSPPQGYQPQKAASDQEACIICLHNTKDTLVMPCSHMALCWVCAETLASGGASSSLLGIGGGGPSGEEEETTTPSGSGTTTPPLGSSTTSRRSETSSSMSPGGDSPQPRVIRRRPANNGGGNSSIRSIGPGAVTPPPPALCPVCRGNIQSLTFAYVA